jgi:prepilin-type N-terminal cleavage/methylation domain-containing protein
VELTKTEDDFMTTNCRAYCTMNKKGFTLAEAMMAVMVLGIAAASVLLPFTSGAAVRAEGINRTLAARLASDLMEQILLLPFHDPNDENSYSLGPESGDYDNIDDYHGYSEPQGQVKDAAREVFSDPAYANFSRYVTCEYVYVPQQQPESDPAKCEFICITIKVDHNGKQTATIVRLVSE